MEAILAVVLCLICFTQVSFGQQRFVVRNAESRFDPRWRRASLSSSQGGALDRNEWADPLSNLRSGLNREDRQMLRLLDLGSLGDRVTSRTRSSGTGRRRDRGSQIAIEFDTRGRTRSRDNSRGFTRIVDSGSRVESSRFRTSSPSRSSFDSFSSSPSRSSFDSFSSSPSRSSFDSFSSSPSRSSFDSFSSLPSRSSFDSFNSRSSPDVIMISSRADRRSRTDNGRQFAEIGVQRSSQPVVIRARDQVVSRSDFIRSSRPSQDTRINIEPRSVSTASRSTAPSGSWQEVNVPRVATAVDSFSNNQPPTSPIVSNSNLSPNTGTRSPDILIQTSAHVNPSGSNTLVSSTNLTNKGSLSSVSNSHIVTAHAPTSSPLDLALLSLVDQIGVGHSTFPRPTEEPLELEEMLMRQLMRRVR